MYGLYHIFGGYIQRYSLEDENFLSEAEGRGQKSSSRGQIVGYRPRKYDITDIYFFWDIIHTNICSQIASFHFVMVSFLKKTVTKFYAGFVVFFSRICCFFE